MILDILMRHARKMMMLRITRSNTEKRIPKFLIHLSTLKRQFQPRQFCANLESQTRKSLGTNSGGGSLKQINYPGTGNNSQFVYDPFDRNVKMIEVSAGTTTSTKQFAWNSYRRNEARDMSGIVTAQYFAYGESIGGTAYFWAKDSSGSVREMTNSSASLQSEYAFDPFGRVSRLQFTVDSDFQYGTYYYHNRSGLNFATFRQYNASLGRWLNRDPVQADSNFFSYVGNNPISYIDQFGLDPVSGIGDALKKICNDPDCVDPADRAKCLADAQKISGTLNPFVNHYSDPDNRGSVDNDEAVNGYWCYDWAYGIHGALSGLGQSSFAFGYRWFVDFRHPKGTSQEPTGEPATNYPTHWAVPISPPGKNCPKCTVNVDDAFGHGFGPGNVHPGGWGAPPGWSEATNPPPPDQRYPIQPMPWPVKKR